MTERKLKKTVVYALYAMAFIAVMSTIYVLEVTTSKNKFDDDTTYVDDTIISDEVPVVSVKDTIMRPYDTNGTTVLKSFYDYQGEASGQQNSIIYYEKTYLQNSGVDYGASNEPFGVLAILPGTVTNVVDSPLLGKTVEVKHENGLVSLYQSLSEVNVALNDQVLQHQIVGVSGSSNIDTSLGNHLHFELIHNGVNVNPEVYYDKQLSEI